MAGCLWHPHCSVEHFLPCTESHQVTQVEKDHLQQLPVFNFLIRNYHPRLVISLDSPAVPSQSATFHNEPEACVAEDLQMLEVKPSL